MRFILFVVVSSWYLLKPIDAYAQTIKVAAIDWCPQICPNQDKPGYVIELVKEVYKDSPYQLDIQYFPWSRAIKYVSEGKFDALLSPAKAEAPNLSYPDHAVGSQSMCFFTKKESPWRYKEAASLAKMQIGIANDTSIEELNDYVKQHPNQFQFQPYHERYVLQNANKLDKDRIDAFLFTKNTTIYELTKAALWDRYKVAGCVSVAPIYMAFTPEVASAEQVKSYITFFDQRMKTLSEARTMQKLLVKYALN